MRRPSVCRAGRPTTIEIRSGNETPQNTDVMGFPQLMAEVRNINGSQAAFNHQTDYDHRGQVVFIGADVADPAFFLPTSIRSGRVGVGRKPTNTKVIAVLRSVLAAPSGQSQDNFMIIPLHPLKRSSNVPRLGGHFPFRSCG